MTPFLWRQGEDWIFDGAVFEGYATELLEQALRCRPGLVVLDELGGAEFACPRFMAALDRLLCSELRCLGVYKQRANDARQRAAMPNLPDRSAQRRAFEQRLLASGGVLLTLTPENRGQVARQIDRFIAGS